MTVKRAFGYVRVSSLGQVEGDGFRRQESEIATYAQSNDFGVVEMFREEGVSGTTDEAARPAFQKMVAAVLKDGVRTVIVEDMSRLAREYRIQETLLISLASKGVALISARAGENITEATMADPMKKALVQIQGVFAELEKGLLVKKLRVTRERKREETGKCQGRKGIQEAAPELLAEVRKIRRTKPGQKQMSFAQIAVYLNAQGKANLNGKPFIASGLQSMIYERKLRR